MTPAVGREPRFGTGLRQELLAIPSPFDRDLRQQQPAAAALLDDETVTADDDGSGVARIDLLERPENRNLDVEIVKLRGAKGIETWIFTGRADRNARDLVGQWEAALQRADAAAQPALALQRDEGAARDRQQIEMVWARCAGRAPGNLPRAPAR